MAGFGQQKLDTLALQEASIESFRIPIPAIRASGAVTIISQELLQNGMSPDIEDAVNVIPGVKMETRGIGGSRRIQMRSSGLRSPFAVRNVHMLSNGFVLTSASGSSPLEMWNPQWLERLEVLLGPTGALLGGGYGGALIGHSLPRFESIPDGNSVSWRTQVSSTGDLSADLPTLASDVGFSYDLKKENQHVRVNTQWTTNPGYRAQESNDKRMMEFHQRWVSKSSQKGHLWIGHLNATWDLPGSITAESALENPQQAPGLDFDAHVERERTWIGWSHRIEEGDRKNGLWLFAQLSDKTNPYGTSPFYQGFKTESESNGSARWWRAQSYAIGGRYILTWDQSVIGRFERLQINERDLIAELTTPRYDLVSMTSNVWMGTGVRLESDNDFVLDAQLGIEWMDRNTVGTFFDSSIPSRPYNEDYQMIRPAPRLSLSFPLQATASAFIQYAEGTSHPNSFELVDPETNDLYDLLPERCQALEFGAKGALSTESKLNSSWSLNAYGQKIRDAIASVEGENDGVTIQNVAGLRMTGVEGQWKGGAVIRPLQSVQVHLHGSINRHHFERVAEHLPGTPLHTAGASVTYQHRRWTWKVANRWNDRTPLRNDQSAWAPAYARLDAHVSRKFRGGDIRIGIRNALNAQYSNWLQVNGFGGKFYNPAPGRTFWVSLKMDLSQ
jgi:iron complex outermembrane recepter protein